MSKNSIFTYENYKNIKIRPLDENNAFKLVKTKTSATYDFIALENRYSNEKNFFEVPGISIHYMYVPTLKDESCNYKHFDIKNKTKVTLSVFKNGNFTLTSNYKHIKTSFHLGDLYYSYSTENSHAEKVGFSVDQNTKREITITKYSSNRSSIAGILISESSEISFIKFNNRDFSIKSIVESKKLDFKIPFKGINNTTMIKNSSYHSFSEKLSLSPLIINKDNFAKGMMISNNVTLEELNMKEASNKYPKEGASYLPSSDATFTMGYAIKDKYGNISFKGPRLFKTFDDEYEASLGIKSHQITMIPKYAEFHIDYISENKTFKGIGLVISEFNYIHVYSQDDKNKLICTINYDDLSIKYNDKIYKNPFFEETTEDEELEEIEEFDDIKVDEKETIKEGDLEDLLAKYLNDGEEEKPSEVKNDVTNKKETQIKKKIEKPKKIRKKINFSFKDFFKKIGDAFIRFFGIILTPFFFIKDKIHDFFYYRKRAYRRRKYSPYYQGNIFTRFFKALGNFFLAAGKILLNIILFIPKMIGKGIAAIFGGIGSLFSEASFGVGSIIMIVTTIISGIMFILSITGAVVHIDNFFSDLVSERIISLLGLHLCKLFLDAVGVNFFSCLAVAVIFLVDLVINILILLLLLLTLIIYLLYSFVLVMGIGAVALIAFIVALILSIKDEDSKALLIITLLINIGLLIPYYLLVIPQLSA